MISLPFGHRAATLDDCRTLFTLIETSGIDRVCDIGAVQVVLQLSSLFSLVSLVYCVEHRSRKNYICYSGSRDLEAVFQQGQCARAFHSYFSLQSVYCLTKDLEEYPALRGDIAGDWFL